MNRVNVRRLTTAALAFLWLGVSVLSAEVKLRIYLQDGSLQAGNLVTETADSFVILGKDGRVELKKKNIMFINGKTLKQWDERPDKLFQTEIMPSEVPNPAFVNSKATLPPVPKLPVTPPTPAVLAPVEPEPVSAPVAVAKPEPKVEPRAQARKVQPKAPRILRVEPAVVAAPAQPEVVAPPPTPVRRSPSRKLAERAARGAVHRQKGFAFLEQGNTGQAMQQFMIARILEPDNGDTNLALGRIHHVNGVPELAIRALSHWTLRKSEAAAAEIAAINRETATRARNVLYMQMGAGLSLFSWLPFVLLYRRIRRRRLAAKPAEVEAEAGVEATAIEEKPAVRPADWVIQAEARFAEAAAVAAAEAVTPLKLAPPPLSTPEPVELPQPSEIVREEEVFAEEPPSAPEPVFIPAPEPVAELPAAEPEPIEKPVEEPEPVYRSAAASADFDPSEILAMARSVENALVRANAAATAGRADEARRGYRTALALNADCASAHLGLGYLAFIEEKWDTSLLHYRQALEIDPSSADAHYGAARVLLEVNRVDDAVPELRATLTIDPTHGDARDALTAIGKPA